MNVPEIFVDGEQSSHSQPSKRQSFLGFLGKTKERFRSPSPGGRSRGNSHLDVKMESLASSFTWTDEIPSQPKLAEVRTKIKWVEKTQKVLDVEQKCEYDGYRDQPGGCDCSVCQN